MTTIVLTSGTSWTVPGDFNTASNTIETYGGGGGGGGMTSNTGGGGGGGGQYSKISNWSGSGSITINIGARGTGSANGSGTNGGAGGGTWFNGTTLAGSSCSAGGGGGGTAGGAGGATGSGGVGTTQSNGGTGGAGGGTNAPAGGGGGCGGAAGAGVNGGAGVPSSQGGNGGAGDNSSGGAGGAGGGGNTTGGNGTANQAGGGGGGGAGFSGSVAVSGGSGGLPGGGGGGAGGTGFGGGTGGNGGGGQIVITYTPVSQTGGSTSFTEVPPLTRYRQLKAARDGDRWDFQGWQQWPLAASGPATMALGFTTELPYNTRASMLSKHSMQGWQQSPLSGNFVNASPPEPAYDLPPRGVVKHQYLGWLQAPLSADSLPEIQPRPIEPPPFDRKTWYRRYDFSGWQQGPLTVELPMGGRWTDLPQRTWVSAKYEYQGWQRGVIPNEFLVPLPQTDVPAGRFNASKFQGWVDQPRPADVVMPPIQPFTDLPPRSWDRRMQYQGLQLAPQPEIMMPPEPQWDVPAGRYNMSRYQGWTQGVIPKEYDVPLPVTEVPPRGAAIKWQFEGWVREPLSADVMPPMPSSMFFDVPQGSRASAWRQQQAYTGMTAAPSPPNVAPAVNAMWLPLLGVGNQGP